MEQVLVVKRSAVEEFIGGKNGLIRDDDGKMFEIISTQHEFMPREEAEVRPDYKQIIPYVTLLRGEQIFTTRRLNKGGEARLHGKLSIGVGGHINPADDTGDLLMNGLWREIHEEVHIVEHGELTPRGFINDDSNEVGSVHLGALFTLPVEGEVRVRETEKLEGLWLTKSELLAASDMLETWASIALEVL